MRKRRLKAALSSMPLPAPQKDSARASLAAQTASAICCSTRLRYFESAHVDFS